VLRDALNGRIRSVKGWEAIRDPAIDSIEARLPLTLAEDYVSLGDALARVGDRDGALAAYEDARVVTARAGRDPVLAPVRMAALRGEAAMWKGLGQEERGKAATILADADGVHPAPGNREAFVIRAVQQTEMPSFKRLASAPVLAGASAGSMESFVVTEVGSQAAATVAEALELLRSGAAAWRVEALTVRLAALAPPPPPVAVPVPGATDSPGTPPPSPSTTPPAPPAPADPAPPPAAKGDLAARLKRLEELHEQKVVTDSEYASERARLLKEGL
jgi:hypothetical protein